MAWRMPPPPYRDSVTWVARASQQMRHHSGREATGSQCHALRRWRDQLPVPVKHAVKSALGFASAFTTRLMLSIQDAVGRHLDAPRGDHTVSIIGFHESASGLGVMARALTAALSDLRPIVCSISDLSPSPRDPQIAKTIANDNGITRWSSPDRGVVIHAYNPDVFPRLMLNRGIRLFHRRAFHVAYVTWETSTLPRHWVPILRCYDAVIAPSQFVALAVSHAIGRSVPVVPIYISPVSTPEREITPPLLRFVTFFDHLSSVHRKNPFAVVEAFRLAIPRIGRDKCQLLIKCHSSVPQHLLETLRGHARGLPVHLLPCTLDSSAMEDLWARCDCYVSLHRSEGFGLPVAECLARGIPVITTRQGGVLDFTDDASVFFVTGSSYRPPLADRLYSEYSGWLEPDVVAAASHMKAIATDYREALVKAARGRAAVHALCSAHHVKQQMNEAIAGLGECFGKSAPLNDCRIT
jgi:glycosyltransferase involved in cell wall biosynthesis